MSTTIASAQVTLATVKDGRDGAPGKDGDATEATAQAQAAAASAQAASASASAAKQAVDNLSVGGRNYIRHTKMMPVQTKTNSPDGVSRYAGTGTLTDTGEGVKLTFSGSMNAAFSVPLAFDGCIESDTQVTLSFTYRGNITSAGSMYFLQRKAPNVAWKTPGALVDDGAWHEYSYTWRANNANDRICYQMLLFYSLGKYASDKWVEIKRGSLKLEVGNVATDWTPAPEDLQNSINNAQTSASNAQSTATAAQDAASTAQSTADSAQSTAETAKSTADAASTAAADANTAAAAANTAAGEAQGMASSAQTAADNAQSTATAAQADAANAQSAAAAAQSTAGEALGKVNETANYFFHDAEGAHVGTVEGNGSSGPNALITSGKMAFREDTSELMTIEPDKISLGKSSPEATIEFCGGTSTIHHVAATEGTGTLRKTFISQRPRSTDSDMDQDWICVCVDSEDSDWEPFPSVNVYKSPRDSRIYLAANRIVFGSNGDGASPFQMTQSTVEKRGKCGNWYITLYQDGYFDAYGRVAYQIYNSTGENWFSTKLPFAPATVATFSAKAVDNGWTIPVFYADRVESGGTVKMVGWGKNSSVNGQWFAATVEVHGWKDGPAPVITF